MVTEIYLVRKQNFNRNVGNVGRVMKVEVFREFSGKFLKGSDSNGRRTPFPMQPFSAWYLLMSGKNM